MVLFEISATLKNVSSDITMICSGVYSVLLMVILFHLFDSLVLLL